MWYDFFATIQTKSGERIFFNPPLLEFDYVKLDAWFRMVGEVIEDGGGDGKNGVDFGDADFYNRRS